MTRRVRLGLLWAVLGVAVLGAALARPIPQDPAYHRFADTRAVWGLPNALNVLSNGAFVLVRALGLRRVWPPVGGGRGETRGRRAPVCVGSVLPHARDPSGGAAVSLPLHAGRGSRGRRLGVWTGEGIRAAGRPAAGSRRRRERPHVQAR